MNLEALFRDFEARLAAQQQQIMESDAKDTRISEFAHVTILDRLAGCAGQSVALKTNDDRLWRGELESVGFGWSQMRVDSGSALIPVSAVLWWEGAGQYSEKESGQTSRKLSFAFALRALARYKVEIRVYLAGGHELEGRLDRVGADFLEMRTSPSHAKGSLTHTRNRLVPLGNINAVVVTN